MWKITRGYPILINIVFSLPSGYDEQFAMVFRWPIEKEVYGLKVVIFHGELLNNQGVRDLT